MSRPEMKQTQIRLTEADEKVVDFLRRRAGIQSLSELVRFALREAAASRGWEPASAPPAPESDDRQMTAETAETPTTAAG